MIFVKVPFPANLRGASNCPAIAGTAICPRQRLSALAVSSNVKETRRSSRSTKRTRKQPPRRNLLRKHLRRRNTGRRAHQSQQQLHLRPHPPCRRRRLQFYPLLSHRTRLRKCNRNKLRRRRRPPQQIPYLQRDTSRTFGTLTAGTSPPRHRCNQTFKL